MKRSPVDISPLREFVAASSNVEDLLKYGRDWSMNFSANPVAVVFPEREDQVVRIVKWANETQTPLVPSGGRTGLSSSATATNREVVVSFERMNQILDFNETDRIVTLEPGVITETLQNFALKKGYFFPVDLAAKGSSQIGGNVATNVGGLRVLRYGMMRNWVFGLRVVTGIGEKLYLGKSLVKNATGFNLKDLFIGSEGTLGLITQVELKVIRPPEEITVLVLGLKQLSHVISVYSYFMDKTRLSACEVFSDLAMKKVMEMHDLKTPFRTSSPFYLLLEVQHNHQTDPSDTLNSLFEFCFERGWVEDGVISQSPTQARELWNLREFIGESISPMSPYRNDISVRTSNIPSFVVEVEAAYRKEYPNFEVIWFGHIGDGNLHIDILKPVDMDKTEFIGKCKQSDNILFSIVQKHRGAVSAEHGVGLLKKDSLNYSRSQTEIELMRQIKTVFDPNHILNPGKIFDL